MNPSTAQTLCQVGIVVFSITTILCTFGSSHYGKEATKLKDKEAMQREETIISQQKQIQETISKVADKLGTEAKSNSRPIIANRVDAQDFGKYGGAVIIKLAMPGIPQERRCIFDYGDENSLNKNRVSLYIDPNEILTVKLYDNEEYSYQLSAKINIVPNESKEIMCLWNKEYGVLALFVNGLLAGKLALKALNIQPIVGEIMFGSSLQGEQGMDMLLEEIRIYSFKS